MNKDELRRLAVVETKVAVIDEKVDGLHTKLDSFISTADDKYAHKERVDALENTVIDIRLQLAKWAGIIGAVWVLIELALKFIF